MTLIVHVLSEHGFYCVSDVMVTHRGSPDSSPIDLNHPLARMPAALMTDRDPEVGYATLIRKVCDVGNGSILMWAGPIRAAKSLAEIIKTQDAGASYLEEVGEWMKTFPGTDCSFMFSHTAPGSTHHYRQNYLARDWGSRRLRYAGSGAENFSAAMAWYEERDLSETFPPLTDESAPIECAMMIGRLAAWEFFGQRAERWGGCLEGMFRQRGKLWRLERVMHSFTVVRRSQAGIQIQPFVYSQSRTYQDDSLILTEATVIPGANPDLTLFVKRHQIPSLLWDGVRADLMQDAVLFGDPSIELHVHTFVISDDILDAFITHQIMLPQEYVNDHVTAVEDLGVFKLNVSLTMEGILREEIDHFFGDLKVPSRPFIL